ncbi:MAG: alpha/beta hydrolase [Bdellovibrionales bacterium]|nr:alpha/beta hydrolase [Bdellovibrionales bacterium]
MESFIKLILIIFALSSAACTSMIYQPDNYLYALPKQFHVEFTPIIINSKDGTSLSAWRLYSKTPKPKRLLLYFHGNAQNLTAHFLNTVWMTEHETDIIIFDYRGYGLSEGKPNPAGVREDGLAFLNYAHDQFMKGGFKQFIVYGQSLGGSILLGSLEDFSHRSDIDLLVLDSTFLSAREVAQEKTFWPLSLVISTEADAKASLSHITMPVLSIHSTKDDVINFKLGAKLNESILNSPKKNFWSYDDPGHGEVFFVQKKKFQTRFLEYLEMKN